MESGTQIMVQLQFSESKQLPFFFSLIFILSTIIVNNCQIPMNACRTSFFSFYSTIVELVSECLIITIHITQLQSSYVAHYTSYVTFLPTTSITEEISD